MSGSARLQVAGKTRGKAALVSADAQAAAFGKKRARRWMDAQVPLKEAREGFSLGDEKLRHERKAHWPAGIALAAGLCWGGVFWWLTRNAMLIVIRAGLETLAQHSSTISCRDICRRLI